MSCKRLVWFANAALFKCSVTRRMFDRRCKCVQVRNWISQMKEDGKAFYRGNTYLLAGVRLQKQVRAFVSDLHVRLTAASQRKLTKSICGCVVLTFSGLIPDGSPLRSPCHLLCRQRARRQLSPRASRELAQLMANPLSGMLRSSRPTTSSQGHRRLRRHLVSLSRSLTRI